MKTELPVFLHERGVWKLRLVKVTEGPSLDATKEAARRELLRLGWGDTEIQFPESDPAEELPARAPNPAPAPEFTHAELEAMWHMLGEPGDTRWTPLRSALSKLDAYVKRTRGEG